MTTLIIGAHSGIGRQIFLQEEDEGQVFIPTQEELDVRNQYNFANYFERHKDMDTRAFDRVVYCAGVNEPELIGEMDSYNVDATFRINVMGFIWLLDALKNYQWLRGEEVQYGCSIVAVVSDAATTAMRGSIAYCASKAALAQAIRCAARELAPHWRVNGVSPSVVEGTPMTEKIDALIPTLRGWTPEQAREYEMSLVPMGRRARKDEVAQLVLDVLEGPEFLTGAIIPLTGGK